MDAPPWRLEISQRARRDLKRLSPDFRSRLVAALDGLTAIPRTGDIKKLSGSENQFRLRVGDWRVIFQPDTKLRVVVILAVSHRRDAYRD